MAGNDRDEVVVVDPYIYIWLDRDVDTTQGQSTKSCIQQMVSGRLRTFANPDECVDYMTSEITTQKIYLIVSNQFGHYIVPMIYDIPQIEKVYVLLWK